MNTKQCEDCLYWRKACSSGYVKGKICHYNLDTCVSKVMADGICLSKKASTDKGKAHLAQSWRAKARKWDTVKATELRAQGMTYPAIAKELGTAKAAVQSYFGSKKREAKR